MLKLWLIKGIYIALFQCYLLAAIFSTISAISINIRLREHYENPVASTKKRWLRN